MNTFTIDNILIESENHFLEASLQFDKEMTDLMLMEAQVLLTESDDKKASERIKQGIIDFFKVIGEWFKKIGNIIKDHLSKAFKKIGEALDKAQEKIGNVSKDTKFHMTYKYIPSPGDMIRMLKRLTSEVKGMDLMQYESHREYGDITDSGTSITKLEVTMEALKKQSDKVYLGVMTTVGDANTIIKSAKELFKVCRDKLVEIHKYSKKGESDSKKAEGDAKRGKDTSILNGIKNRLTILRHGLGKEYKLIGDCMSFGRTVTMITRTSKALATPEIAVKTVKGK